MYAKLEPEQIARPAAPSQPYPPRFHHFSPAYMGDIGGGFATSQLAMPPSQQRQIHPSYFQSANPVAMQVQNAFSSNEGLAAQEQASRSAFSSESRYSREMSADPLVDVNTVPDFSFQSPNGPPISTPYSVVDSQHFNPLTQGPPQIATAAPQSSRLHNMPPALLRSQSMPIIPTINSSSEVEPYHSPGGYGDAHSSGRRRSGESEEWEDQETDEQLLSREASSEESMENAQAGPVEHPNLPGQWGYPMVYPAPPVHHSQQINQYPSSASSSPTSSTLVAPSLVKDQSPTNALPPFSNFVPIGYQMSMTPLTPYGSYPPPAPPMDMVWNPQYASQPVRETPISLARLQYLTQSPVQYRNETSYR